MVSKLFKITCHMLHTYEINWTAKLASCFSACTMCAICSTSRRTKSAEHFLSKGKSSKSWLSSTHEISPRPVENWCWPLQSIISSQSLMRWTHNLSISPRSQVLSDCWLIVIARSHCQPVAGSPGTVTNEKHTYLEIWQVTFPVPLSMIGL